MAKEEKSQLDKDLADALKIMHKKFGDDSILTFDDTSIKKVDAISTGSLNLDVALGIGGLPEGRVNVIYGEPSSGKTTIALQLCAEAQKKGYLVAYLDNEHAMDLNYAKALGVDLKRLLFAQPESGTKCFAIAEELLKSTNTKLIVFDSISTMLTESEINGEIGDNFIGRQAKLMSDGLKRITPLMPRNNCMCFFISQTRKNIGVMFGDTDVMSGGLSASFYASVIIKIWKKNSPTVEKVNGEDIATSVETTVKVTKNKVAPPFRTAKFIIRYGQGVSQAEEILDLSFKFGLLERAGSWIKYKGENVAQGKEKAMQWLKDNPDLMNHFKETILEYIRNKNEELDLISDEEEHLAYDLETGEILEDNNNDNES